MIMAAEPAPPKNSPQEIATDVMNDMIGGTFSSRLNMNLREDKHWSYGFQSVPGSERAANVFGACPGADRQTKESLTEMNKELHEFAAAKPVTDTELQAAVLNRAAEPSGLARVPALGGIDGSGNSGVRISGRLLRHLCRESPEPAHGRYSGCRTVGASPGQPDDGYAAVWS
jgi:hypothetical protein